MFFRNSGTSKPEEKKSPQSNNENIQKTNQQMIVLIGGPGSGKGTHSKILESNKGYIHISTGDVLRKILKEDEIAEKKDPSLEKIRTAMNKGELLNDQMIIDILKKEISKYTDVPGFLIDGSPRTIGQIHLFEKQIKAYDKIIYLEASDETLQQRMRQRSAVEQRADDNEETIKNRIKIFREQTFPVVNYFAENSKNIFSKIDASGSIAEVAKQLELALSNDCAIEKFAKFKL